MAKAGDWGGDKSQIPRAVPQRTAGFTKRVTSTVSDPSFVVAEEAPKLRYIPDPWYVKEPMDPEFKSNEAKGTTGKRRVDLGR